MKIAIVEDEDVAAEELEQCLEKYAEEKGIDVEVARFIDPKRLLTEYRPIYDIIFMDIVMPHINGFAAAHSLREFDSDVLLVFVTNMKNYAIKGYEVSAFDFIVKPVTYNVIKLKMNRALGALSVRNKDIGISVCVGGATKVLSSRDITYVEINGHTLTYHTKDGDWSLRDSMERAENTLGGDFARCNNCYLVNLAYVKEVRGNVVDVAGVELAVSRNKKKAFLDALASYLGKRS